MFLAIEVYVLEERSSGEKLNFWSIRGIFEMVKTFKWGWGATKLTDRPPNVPTRSITDKR